ncbi:MAG: GAF domain-containing sensor histidine kinase [Cyanobacteriota bacterium]
MYNEDPRQVEGETVIQRRIQNIEEYDRMLQRRDRLLIAAAKAANVLLTMENFDEAINTALRMFLEGAGCDQINILENIYESSSALPDFFKFIYQWSIPSLSNPKGNLGTSCIRAENIDSTFLRQNFLEGDGFGGLLDEWIEPLRSLLAQAQVKSAYSVPIRVNGQWWGALCFDYCREAIQVSPAEVAVLRTIADCIGSAIQRERTQNIILQAEQTRVAELVKANTALKQSLDTLATDPDLDGFIGNTLKLIAQQFDAPLLEYWVHADPRAYVHLTYWQGQILNTAQRTQLLDQLGGDPDQLFISLGLLPFLDIPLSVGDMNIGDLAIFLPSFRIFSGQTIELAHALAQQLTLAVALSRLAEEAQQAALLQERTRMAREIHDTLAQAFGGILMQLQAVQYFTTTQPEKAQAHLQTAQILAQEGLAEARRSVWTLYLEATEYEDPAKTIAKFIDQTTSGQSVPIQFQLEGTPYHLHPDLGLNLLRITQEAIANALRHARAQTIRIQLHYSPQTIQLTVQDDGCGFDPQQSSHGFGLLGMQQRAARIGATWHLVSQLGQGTTIAVTLNMANPST